MPDERLRPRPIELDVLVCCPCCGRRFPSDPKWRFTEERMLIRNGTAVRLTPLEYRIVFALRTRRMPIRGLIDAVYIDHPDGGPLSAASSVHCTVHKLNKKLSVIALRVGVDLPKTRGALYSIHDITEAAACESSRSISR